MGNWIIRDSENRYLQPYTNRFELIPTGGFASPTDACNSLIRAFTSDFADIKDKFYLERINIADDGIIEVVASVVLICSLDDGKYSVNYRQAMKKMHNDARDATKQWKKQMSKAERAREKAKKIAKEEHRREERKKELDRRKNHGNNNNTD